MERDLAQAFINLIKSIRETRGLTKEHLADLAGVHRTTIGLLEKGERYPTLQLSNQLAEALQLPLSELVKEAESIVKGITTPEELALIHNNRTPKIEHIRNANKLLNLTGLEPKMLLGAIESCYNTLDSIDEQLAGKGGVPLAHLVELANLSSMVGNMIGGGIAECSDGLYIRNRPHAYPDLLPQKAPAVDLELKMALETNKPKGHLPKAGTYITFRYVLGDKFGNFNRGKDNRGDTVWIWEVKVGQITEDDFSCSNTEGDSGKTAVIKTDIFNEMALVYYNEDHLPYTKRKVGGYVGYN
ncbi:helix-turn-helix transcriptional regulator [Vibrio cholerae]|uniref:helix-turn-helix domain-containing protein n=1 Tax=Vibrio cholerae TaxID=666 RepID=UPI000BA9BD46|nr:helix-turn-helix transcriptional regulator [Vibrio cholerae]EIB4934408.1 helix-turn-helix transcriptional regulator [Vibrio cholerae]EJL6713368.1 helix-turn-helix transcriptional regulator [Vibrio cholerae]EMC2458316.1 helix-turn-helix transcriptional regulator [Vibrio cholerae]PAS19152.1 XRE family transcriptional regulator [Vibrio cholerae]PAS22729.1 XRE family transcriptional regulator [Vibrio cholerae]